MPIGIKQESQKQLPALCVPFELLLGFSVLRRPTYYIHVAVHSQDTVRPVRKKPCNAGLFY